MRPIVAELSNRFDEPRNDDERPIGRRIGPQDIVSSYAKAQFGWDRSAGRLGYVEGVEMRAGQDSSRRRPIMRRAWNHIGGKVVDFSTGGADPPDASYYGVVLDTELEYRLRRLRARPKYDPRDALSIDKKGRTTLDVDKLGFVFGAPVLQEFLERGWDPWTMISDP